MHADTRVQLSDVTYTYEEQAAPALSGVSAVVKPGEFVAVLDFFKDGLVFQVRSSCNI